MKWATTSFWVWADEDVSVSKGVWGRGSMIGETGEREESVRRARVRGRECIGEQRVVE